MNASAFNTMNYEQRTMNCLTKTNPIQTQLMVSNVEPLVASKPLAKTEQSQFDPPTSLADLPAGNTEEAVFNCRSRCRKCKIPPRKMSEQKLKLAILGTSDGGVDSADSAISASHWLKGTGG
jgi:hypothetical protein